MHDAISLVLLGVTNEHAHEGLGRELAVQLVRDMDKCFAAENMEVGHIWLILTSGFLGCAVVKRISQRDIVNEGSVLKSFPLVSVRQFGINEHCTDSLDKHAVHVLCDSVVLWCVSGG